MQYTYPSLLASCQNYCIDNSTQYEDEFPNIVSLSEMRIIKDLNLSVFDTTGMNLMTSGNQSITKPDDFIVEQDFFLINAANERVYLQKRSKSWLDDYWRNPNTQDTPIYYCDNTTVTWLVAPTPDQNYTYQVNYIARPASMTAANPTTWIGDKLGELLFYAVLRASMPFFREDVANEQGITQEWERSYQTALAEAARELAPLMSATDNQVTPMTRNN